MNEKNLITYYNKFNEDKRLTRRHGIVEYETTMIYVNELLSKMNNPLIIDVGAGTGKYSVALSNEGYDVTAVELVKHNLKTLTSKNSNVKAYLGNALDLETFKNNSFDMVLLFGPMYHLISKEDKIKALMEAKRIVKNSGVILVSYYMNDYAVLKYGFMQNNIKDSVSEGKIDDNFHVIPKEDELYSMVRLDDINELNQKVNLKRVKIIAQDGPSDYMRQTLNNMDEETFHLFLKYHLSTCEKIELLGSSSHVLDILKK